jgi:hypothetical protein
MSGYIEKINRRESPGGSSFSHTKEPKTSEIGFRTSEREDIQQLFPSGYSLIQGFHPG